MRLYWDITGFLERCQTNLDTTLWTLHKWENKKSWYIICGSEIVSMLSLQKKYFVATAPRGHYREKSHSHSGRPCPGVSDKSDNHCYQSSTSDASNAMHPGKGELQYPFTMG